MNTVLISEIITGDETWIFYFIPQGQTDKIFLTKKAKRPVIAKQCERTNLTKC